VALLSPSAKFFIINAYATNTSELAIQNLLEDAMQGREGSIESGQLCLKQRSGRMLSTGIFARWTKKG
jgi:23S rRNA (cytosine1962-C5)-methyltransferase